LIDPRRADARSGAPPGSAIAAAAAASATVKPNLPLLMKFPWLIIART
jgi:hypothetical protein